MVAKADRFQQPVQNNATASGRRLLSKHIPHLQNKLRDYPNLFFNITPQVTSNFTIAEQPFQLQSNASAVTQVLTHLATKYNLTANIASDAVRTLINETQCYVGDEEYTVTYSSGDTEVFMRHVFVALYFYVLGSVENVAQFQYLFNDVVAGCAPPDDSYWNEDRDLATLILLTLVMVPLVIVCLYRACYLQPEYDKEELLTFLRRLPPAENTFLTPEQVAEFEEFIHLSAFEDQEKLRKRLTKYITYMNSTCRISGKKLIDIEQPVTMVFDWRHVERMQYHTVEAVELIDRIENQPKFKLRLSASKTASLLAKKHVHYEAGYSQDIIAFTDFVRLSLIELPALRIQQHEKTRPVALAIQQPSVSPTSPAQNGFSWWRKAKTPDEKSPLIQLTNNDATIRRSSSIN